MNPLQHFMRPVPPTDDDAPQSTPQERSARLRDNFGVAGYLSLTCGVAMLSVPWAMIVGGGVMLTISIYGALRSDLQTTRHQRRDARTDR